MGVMASGITSLAIVYSTVNAGTDQGKKSKLRVIGLCAGNSPVTGEFPAQMASNAENANIWWRYHDSAQRDVIMCWTGSLIVADALVVKLHTISIRSTDLIPRCLFLLRKLT